MILDLIKVVILSIVEGITEFLPVSSTGHMILANEFVKLSPENFSYNFMIIVQLGAILSVIVIYFNKLNPFSKEKNPEGLIPSHVSQMTGFKKIVNNIYFWFKNNKTANLWLKIVFAVLPAAVLGVLFDDIIEEKLFGPMPVAAALIVYGIIIIVLEKSNEGKEDFKFTSVFDLDWKTAFLIGCFQVLAMWPGTSRSAATIIGAMILGLNRTAAADFSFFLAIPTMIGASLLKILKASGMTSWQWFLIGLGFVLSFVVAYVVIKKFLDYIKKHDFKVFGYYRIALGILVLLYFAIF